MPFYWIHETSGVLRGAVHAYLDGVPMSEQQIGAWRVYLRQWMAADWQGDDLEALREDVEKIKDRASLSRWLAKAAEYDIDPL